MVMGDVNMETQVLVIGAGPGGYAAAFRAADLGLDVVLVDLQERPGGVCLFDGCIPLGAFQHLTEVMRAAAAAEKMGVKYSKPSVDLEALRSWKNGVVEQLSGGVQKLSKKRNVQFLHGRAAFESSRKVRVSGMETFHVKFQFAILAVGARPKELLQAPFGGKDGRVMDSSAALELADIPERLLVVGAGYLGVQLGTIYAALGSKVTLVDSGTDILPGLDRDLVRPVIRSARQIFENLYLETSVLKVQEKADKVKVHLEGKVKQPEQEFDKVLVTVGRRPNTADLSLENTEVKLDEAGFVLVDDKQRSTDKRIFAIGDVTGGRMLAHKALFEARVAAEVIAGLPAAYDVQAFPMTVYSEPPLAWAGLTEEEAAQQGREVQVLRFPWGASGRALILDAAGGVTKLLVDPLNGRVLGGGFAGPGAPEMISEIVLAVEMGALASDLAWSMHPHPTLSETVMEAAQTFSGQATHVLGRR